MKKILLAGLVAASTVFAQGAMADVVSGKLELVGGGSIGIDAGFGARFNELDPSFSADPGYVTDCSTFVGRGVGVDMQGPERDLQIDLLKEALLNDLVVEIHYVVDPAGGCYAEMVGLHR